MQTFKDTCPFFHLPGTFRLFYVREYRASLQSLFSRRKLLPLPVNSCVSVIGSQWNISTNEKPWVSGLKPTSSLMERIRRTISPVGRRTALWITTRFKLSTYVFGILIGSPQRRWIKFFHRCRVECRQDRVTGLHRTKCNGTLNTTDLPDKDLVRTLTQCCPQKVKHRHVATFSFTLSLCPSILPASSSGEGSGVRGYLRW